MLDLAIGMKTIEVIKKKKLLARNEKTGRYLLKGLEDIKGISNQRGLGLMVAFDAPDRSFRDNLIIECFKRGLVLLGCGKNSVRVIPPYVAGEQEIDEALGILDPAVRKCSEKGFRHTGKCREYLHCARTHT